MTTSPNYVNIKRQLIGYTNFEHCPCNARPTMAKETIEETSDVNILRILSPSGDHFEINAADLTTIRDLKGAIHNIWPKGLESPLLTDFITNIQRAGQ